MNNNTYQEKKHFNAIDVLIILGVLLIILGIIFRSNIITLFRDNAQRSECTISFISENVPNNVAALLGNGNTLTWVEHDIPLGTLETVSSSHAVIYIENGDGTYHTAPSASESTVVGVIKTTALSDNGCYINGTDFIAAGMTVVIATQNAQFTAVITSVSFK